MGVREAASLAAAAQMAIVLLSGNAKAADPGNWSCGKETRDGVEMYVCRDCGPPQPEADGLQICQVYDFTVGVDAFPSTETELVILVTPYHVAPTKKALPFRPPDRLELRRPPASK